MNSEFYKELDLLAREKGIPKDYLFEKIEAALTSAFKKELNGNTNVRIEFKPQKKDLKVFQQKTVVAEVENPDTEILLEDAQKINRRYKLGSIVEFELKPERFRRLSAQAGKQVIIQAIREAERSNMARAYEEKKENIITAIVYKVDDQNGDLVLDTGTGRAKLPRSEQLPDDHFQVGDRVKVFVSEVKSGEERGPLVTLSRVHPGLIKRLFEMEIPEIADGVVIIKGISRDPGSRSKIAVMSRDENVDPIGACIGNRGARIATILEEIGGEKIDVVRYSERPEEYVAAALSPATVLGVTYDGERTCTVKVAPDQLSLAIGKEGQNAKLAAKLTGMRIDIKAS